MSLMSKTQRLEVDSKISDKSEDLRLLDLKVIELLKLVDKYEKTMNDELRVNIKAGHLSLSRANFNSGTIEKQFSVDRGDMRPHIASFYVNIYHGSFKVIDLLTASDKRGSNGKIAEINKVSRCEAMPEKYEETSTAIMESSSGNSSSASHSSKASTVKNRRAVANRKQIGRIKEPCAETIFNPLQQFGCLAPKEIKISQLAFMASLKNVVEALNLQRDLNKLIDEISELTGKI